ncbi:MAG TPA: YceH family protein [Bryobacteraceae bacterium]|nr:YceH family protein [Bryobacteraceae bacterium]
MSLFLDSAEARVLGALVEKEITTPEYYPLTLNALVNACNQKSNRDPVVAYDDEVVLCALEGLKAKRLLAVLSAGSGSRVAKYSHRLPETMNLGRRETALLCELLLRGPQTLGELRNRAERMHRFEDIDEVEICIRSLMQREPEPLAVELPRQPGTKEPRFAHLLSGEPEYTAPAEIPRATSPDRISVLEAEVSALRERVANLESKLADLLQ